MSWYVRIDGRQVWADRDDTVYTVGEPPEAELRLENLAYLSVTANKAVYAEHTIDEEGGGKSKKSKDKQSGRQRGFVVRVDGGDTRTKVSPPMQAAVDHLMEKGYASRIDVDDQGGQGKKKGRAKEPVEEILPPLGANECRVEIPARCQHFAHGRGFQVNILELGSRQKINIFTADQDMKAKDFWQQIVTAIEATGGKTALGRMAASAEDPPEKGGRQAPPKPRDVAQEDEDEWLSSVMGKCMVPKKTEEKPAEAGPGDEDAEGGEAAPKPKAKVRNVPPWLRR